VLLGHVADLHRIRVAHRDIASHSVWLQLPSRVRLSGFIASHFPDTESLGERRSLVVAGREKLPEDVQPGGAATPFAQDVFLLGAALWHLATGDPLLRQAGGVPKLPENGDPFELGPAGRAWFTKALAPDPKDRFRDAIEMRDAFQQLRAKRGAKLEDQSLGRFERDVDVIFDYPHKRILKKAPSRVFLSEHCGQPVIVKHWPLRALGEHWRSGLRVRAFLETAEELRLVPPSNVAQILDLGIDRDGLFVLRKHYEGPTLAESDLSQWSRRQALAYMFSLAETIAGLHERSIFHGDLKPDQIIVSEAKDGPTPTILDLPDFSSEADGDVTNTAFATTPDLVLDGPARDRIALCRLVEYIVGRLAPGTIETPAFERIQHAIASCHQADPPYLTIDLVLRTLADLLDGHEGPAPLRLEVGLRNRMSVEAMHSDNGVFHVWVRPARDNRSPRLRVTGADEELELMVNLQTRRFDRVMLKPVSTHEVALAAKYAAHSFAATIALRPAKDNDATALEWLLDEPAVLTKLEPGAFDESKSEDVEPSEDDDADEAESATGPVDLEKLWSNLISTEEESLPEVTVTRASAFDHSRGLHLVPIDPGATTLDFDSTETVYVQAILPNGLSLAIGELDLGATTPDTLAITQYREHRSFSPGARLRLHGHSDRASFTRRKRGIERITTRQTVIRDLIEYFDTRSQKPALKVAEPPDPAILKGYDLDKSQTDAFVHLWTHGPLGLLQGPPGTGKTTFIAAFVHYALTHGRLKNVLLVSQSHEGVNNAMEKIVKKTRPGVGKFSMIRIGQKGHVSPQLRPYHSDAIQESYREMMHATLKERMQIIGRQLGLPAGYVAEAFEVDARIGQFARAITIAQQDFEESEDDKPAALRRLEDLKHSFAATVSAMGYEDDPAPLQTLDALHARLADEYRIGNLDAVTRLRRTFGLAREYLSALASRHHNLEEFLGRSRNLVCGTCVGIGRTALKIEDNMFDLVVIDEASRANAGELSVAMQVGRRVLLVGDHKQLPPQIDRSLINEVKARYGLAYSVALKRSEFERAFLTSYGQVVGRTLKSQYRMEPAIGTLISKFFYKGELNDAKKDPTPAWYSELPNCMSACVTWLDTSSLRDRANERDGTKEHTSKENVGEADVIVGLLRQIAARDDFVQKLRAHAKADDAPIGLLAMYKAQAILLRDRIAGEEWPAGFQDLVKIATVDGYQGKENPIVIVSLVRNNENYDAGHVRKSYRLNVALSRAQEKLVLVGSTQMWGSKRTGSHLARILDFIRKKADKGDYAIVDARRALKV
jgi:serine/threonine protein kinase